MTSLADDLKTITDYAWLRLAGVRDGNFDSQIFPEDILVRLKWIEKSNDKYNITELGTKHLDRYNEHIASQSPAPDAQSP